MTKQPIDYSPELVDALCARLATGETLRAVCREEGMPTEAAVRQWALADRDGFAAKYARAREIGYLSMADEIVEIADDGSNDWMERQGDDGKRSYVLNGEAVARSRLRLDTRKWLLSKALPKIYGDKIVHAGDPDQPLIPAGSPVADLQAILASINVRIEDKS